MRNVFVLDLIRLVEQTFGRIAVNVERRRTEQALQLAGQDRLARTARGDGRHPAVLDASLQPCDDLGAVEVVLDVIFARPDHLHRAACRPGGDRHRLPDKVRLQPSPEAASDERDFDVYLVAAHACRAGCDQLGQRGDLRGCPKLHSILGHLRRAVDRLHRGMRKIRRTVFGLDNGRTLCILKGLQPITRRTVGEAPLVAVQRADELLMDVSRIQGGMWAIVPLGFECPKGLACLPVMVCHHGDARSAARRAVERHDIPHAGHHKGRFRVEGLELAAEYRAHNDSGIQHAGRPHVDGEAGAAIRLGGDVVARRRLAHQLILRSGLERDIGRRSNLACLLRDRAERHLLSARPDELPCPHRHQRRLHAPFARGCLHQRGARGCGGLAHGLPPVGHAAAGAGDDETDFARALGHDPMQCARPELVRVVRMQRQRAVAHCDDITVDAFDRR